MPDPEPLATSQRLALEYMAEYARARQSEAAQMREEVLLMSDISPEEYAAALDALRKHARVALHFHPDRLGPDQQSVADALLDQGIYKSQFETKLSSGSVTAYPGGARDEWERSLFNGAYQTEGTTDRQRPKYGALDLKLRADGPAPRFGSCYFLLAPEVSRRCTFTYLDSHENPKERGTWQHFESIMAAILRDAFLSEYALGERDLTPRRFIRHLTSGLTQPRGAVVGQPPGRNLNHYVEAQIHGDIRLEEDVVELVADPSFRGTSIGRTLQRLCERYRIALFWHRGFVLAADEVPMDFRGPSMPSLARRIARDGDVSAYAIGRAARELSLHPEAWKDRGDAAAVLQQLKLLWHVLVRYGKPLQGGAKDGT